MKRFNKALCLTLALGGLLLAGCGGGDDGGGGGSNLPGLGSVAWYLNGGAGNIGAATSGGTAGTLTITAGDDVLLDDGRTRPTVTTNFLTAGVLTDSLVTYAELAGIAAPTVAAGTATFTLVGAGFELPAGATLNLSDAPTATVNTVVISTDSPI